MIVQGRWFWTGDRSRLVKEGDRSAAFLAYPHGTEIPDGEAERVGLVQPPVVEPPAAAKSVRKPADKMMPAPSNKGVTQA